MSCIAAMLLPNVLYAIITLSARLSVSAAICHDISSNFSTVGHKHRRSSVFLVSKVLYHNSDGVTLDGFAPFAADI